MDYLDIPALHHAAGTIRLPGSKSISNRVLLLAALAEGETEVRDLLDSEDTRVMLTSLRKLGIAIDANDADSYRVTGANGAFPVKQADLSLGNAGTAFRPLTAALAFSGGHYTLSGVPRMHERPIRDLVDGLRQIGADIRYLGNEGYPPLEIFPAEINLSAPIKLRGDVSSQFLTALLMALPLTGQRAVIDMTTELISQPYVHITLQCMKRFGIDIGGNGYYKFDIPANVQYRSPGTFYIEGDASSASYFLAAGAISGLTGGGPVRVIGVGKNSVQGDVQFAGMLERMGAKITMGDNWIEATAGSEAIARGKFEKLNADCSHIPDAAMTLAMVALFANGKTTLAGVGSWRVKETDRIAAIAAELRKIGAIVEEEPSRLHISPPTNFIAHAEIQTYDDHRMAMCFSLVALGGVPIRILDPNCVAKTFPEYFDRFAEITETSK